MGAFSEQPNGYARWKADHGDVWADLRNIGVVTVATQVGHTYVGVDISPAEARELATALNRLADLTEGTEGAR